MERVGVLLYHLHVIYSIAEVWIGKDSLLAPLWWWESYKNTTLPLNGQSAEQVLSHED